MVCCSRMSLEHPSEKIASASVGAFHGMEFAQNNKKRDALARVLFESAHSCGRFIFSAASSPCLSSNDVYVDVHL